MKVFYHIQAYHPVRGECFSNLSSSVVNHYQNKEHLHASLICLNVSYKMSGREKVDMKCYLITMHAP